MKFLSVLLLAGSVGLATVGTIVFSHEMLYTSPAEKQKVKIVEDKLIGPDQNGDNQYCVVLAQGTDTTYFKAIGESARDAITESINTMESLYLYGVYVPRYGYNGVYASDKELNIGSWEIIDGDTVQIQTFYFKQVN